MIFPFGAKTIETSADRDMEFIWVNTTTPKTILNVRIQQNGVASTTELLCGNVVFTRNYAKDFPQELMIRSCNDVIRVKKVGQDEAFISMTYFEGNLAEETQNPPPQAPQNYFYITNPADTQGNFSIFKNFTYGDITTISLLGCIFFLLIFLTIKQLFFSSDVNILQFKRRTTSKI